jgi:Tfp pilus assembly protein PilF
MKRACVAVLALCAVPLAHAVPFVPSDDKQVLETLPFSPRDPAMRELQILRVRQMQQPNSIPVAVQTARRYIELGRITGDPRYSGYAQAALTPWWQQASPPRDVLVLRATLRQHVHQFDAALADLDLALKHNPRDGQARLTRATVYQVRGEFDAARRDCDALNGTVQELIAAACTTAVEGSTGHLRESYNGLRQVLAKYPAAPADLQAWLLTGLAEMAVRAGLVREADAHFKAALAADPADQYLLAAYADFLLDQGRAREAAALTAPHTRADGLLLRYALALQAEKSTEAARHTEELRARFDASHMRGDRVHLREEARFTLHLAKDPQAALMLAKDNWAVQKEPADARILLEAAQAARDAAVVRTLQSWLDTSKLQDVQLRRLLEAGTAGR